MNTAPRYATLSGPHGDLVLSNRETGQPYRFWLTGLDGWFGGVGIDADDTQRKFGHGVFASAARRTGRVLTLRGTLVFPDDIKRLDADRFLSGLLWDGEFGELAVETGDLTLSARVRLDGEVKHSYRGLTAIDLEVPLLAPDPFLYGPVKFSQVYPTGFGEGLVYPLFRTAGSQIGPELQQTRNTAAAYEIVANKTYRFTSTTLQDVAVIYPTAGKTYQVKVRVKADKPGSKYAVRTHFWGSGKTSLFKYVTGLAGSSTNVVDAGTQWQSWTVNRFAPDGYSVLLVTVFANDASGAVTDAVQDFEVTITETAPVLDWGKGTPVGSAISNLGNADAYPRLVVHGAWPAGFTITTGGKSITYPAPVVSTSPVEIDTRTGEVLVKGVDNAYRLTRREWPKITPGSSIQPRISGLAPSEGWVDVYSSDTYI